MWSKQVPVINRTVVVGTHQWFRVQGSVTTGLHHYQKLGHHGQTVSGQCAAGSFARALFLTSKDTIYYWGIPVEHTAIWRIPYICILCYICSCLVCSDECCDCSVWIRLKVHLQWKYDWIHHILYFPCQMHFEKYNYKIISFRWELVKVWNHMIKPVACSLI